MPDKPRKILRWISIAIGGPLVATLLAVFIFIVFEISIDLSSFRERVEIAASEALNREVSIEGGIELTSGIWPTLQIEDVRIANPPGWPEADFAHLKLARAQLSPWSFIWGDLRFGEVTLSGLTVNMETNAASGPNWLLNTSKEDSRPQTGAPSPGFQIIELQDVSLSDVTVRYRNSDTSENYEIKLKEAKGSAGYDQRVQLFAEGTIQNLPSTMTLTTSPLGTLFDDDAAFKVDFSAQVVGINLAITGELLGADKSGGGDRLALDFVVKGPELKSLEGILGTFLPPIGAFEVSGSFSKEQGVYSFKDFRGVLGSTVFTGNGEIDFSGMRPRLWAAIDVPLVDASPLEAAIRMAKNGPEAGEVKPLGSDAEFDLDELILDLEPLGHFDADFTLTIHDIINSRLTINNASLHVRVMDGALRGPINLTVAQIPFAGEIHLALRDDEPALNLTLFAEKGDIGELFELLTSADDVEGYFERAELEVSVLGSTARSNIETAELKLSIAGADLSYGNEARENPVAFTLDTFEMVFSAADPSRITASGTLLGEPFSFELSAGSLMENYLGSLRPVDLSATGGGAQLQVTGVTGDPNLNGGLNVEFTVAGGQIGGLSRWIGVSPLAAASYTLQGTFTLSDEGLFARFDEGRIGSSSFTGTAGLMLEQDKPITNLDVAFATINLAELKGLFPEVPTPGTPEPADQVVDLDLPILPSGIELADANIDITIERIKMGPSDITDVSFSTMIRNGHVEKAPVRAVLAGATIAGNVSTDLRGNTFKFDLDLHSTEVDLGDLLDRLGIIQGLKAIAGGFDLALNLRGKSFRTLLRQSEFSAQIRDGLLSLQDPNTRDSIDIHIAKGTIKAEIGKPIVLVLDGHLNQTPVRILLQTDSLDSFADSKEELQAHLNIKFLDTELNLTGTTALPIQSQNLHFNLDLSGARLKDLDEFFGVLLPPWGPYQVAGEFGSRKSGYYIENLKFGIGNSQFTGALDLDTTQDQPRLKVDFVAHSIQLDDFEVGSWSPETDPKPSDDIRQLVSREVMRNLDAKITLSVEEVLSGQDHLGHGLLVATLSEGRLTVKPLSVNLPGGEINIAFTLEPTETDITMEVSAKIDQLDYGIIARRIDPTSKTGGLISIDIDLTASAPKFSEFMAGANGHIEFAVWPRDLKARVFDLWAVNLLTAILPSLGENSSKVNCLIGRFGIEDGIMHPTAILVDTSRIQATAKGTIDFRSEIIDFKAVPKPKKPQMFSAKTPVEVEGQFSDFKIGPSAGGLGRSILGIIFNTVVVPFQRAFKKNKPADGKLACEEAWAH